MISEPGIDLEPITFERGTVSEEEVEAFRAAVRAKHGHGILPTFATVFRWGEFRWLDRLHVDMRNLLHTEQEYQYLSPVVCGDVPKITTKLKSYRERAGMKFVTLESEVSCQSKLALIALTTFVIREGAKEKA